MSEDVEPPTADEDLRTVSLEVAARDLAGLIAEVTETSGPVRIVGGTADAVLVAGAEWRSIQETLYLMSIPGMVESIVEGMNTRPEDFVEEIEW